MNKQKRAEDTRRKILLCALVLQRLEDNKDEEFSQRLRDWLRSELPDYLSREADLELFEELLDLEGKPGSESHV